MPKEFYTEKDIEDLFARGIRSLQITDNVVLTELAYEKANRLGLQLISDRADNPPAAPVRPYLSNGGTPHAKPAIAHVPPAVVTQPKPALTSAPSQEEKGSDIETRIRSAVIAKLGNQVDAKLLDNIIHRVVKGVGLK
ncbi:MAG: hypothetical protein EHJ95_07820 [Methanobacteriota archaeon]|nr:MAG: hypothetical protein EHJ95_07820 [Euryarchaeota archaeon]